jgi:hypothetical protein
MPTTDVLAPLSTTELNARKFVEYQPEIILSNKSSAAMSCIPSGSQLPIVAVKGTIETDAEALSLHNRMVEMFAAHLDEDDESEDDEDNDDEEEDNDEDNDDAEDDDCDGDEEDRDEDLYFGEEEENE